ncbi:MAG: hypothetical protein KMY55_07245 [Dethiosulfatibacter sp.]|nr:hypothetical protein [Dethiosulfatibacter sp.]
MSDMDLKEKIWGGIFGVVAIIAALVEMVVNGISTETVIGAIKDISGTLIMVILLVAVVRSLIPKEYSLSFEERLTNALEKWQVANSNMIFKGIVVKDKFDLSIRTDINDFYKATPISKNKSMFLRMPLLKEENYKNGNVVLEFTLTKAIFFDDMPGDDKELMPYFNHLNDKFCEYINNHFHNFVKASGKNKIIYVSIINPIISDEDIEQLIEVINGMYQAYLVAANIKV